MADKPVCPLLTFLVSLFLFTLLSTPQVPGFPDQLAVAPHHINPPALTFIVHVLPHCPAGPGICQSAMLIT
ncbi:hypothetical protein ACV93_22200 [Salmonella enterica]|nr:hypothetical protein [Salmonella enterica]